MNIPSKEAIDQISGAGALIRSAIVVIGVGVVFFYCLNEHMVPDGLSLGDVLLLVLIALSFGLLLVAGLFFGVIAALAPFRLAIYLLTKCQRTATPPVVRGALTGYGLPIASCTMLLTIIALALISYCSGASVKPWMKFSGFCILGGFFMLMIFGLILPERLRLTALGAYAVAGALLLYCLLACQPPLLNMTMVALGVRSGAGSLILVSNEDHERIYALAQLAGIPIRFCQLPGTSQWATHDARTIWHGIGTTSYLALGKQTQATLTTPFPEPIWRSSSRQH